VSYKDAFQQTFVVYQRRTELPMGWSATRRAELPSNDAVPEDRPDHAPESLPSTSSTPPDFPEKQQQLFREVLTHLTSLKIPFAVSGAFALQQHTDIFRFTKDLDIFLTAEDAPAAMAGLEQYGFECEVCDPVWLYKARRDGFFVDLITGMSNAVIVVDPTWIENSKPANVMGVEARVLAAEELIASKLFVTRRERFDGADIAHVIYGTEGKIDWNRILRQVGEHWEVLLWALLLFRYVYPAHTHYVPQAVWQDLLGRFANELANPNPKAAFRGSLIDDRMFAIDVNEWGMEDLLAEYRERRLRSVKRKAA
jgi:hypothetical protein